MGERADRGRGTWWRGAATLGLATGAALAACGSDVDTASSDGRRAPTGGGSSGDNPFVVGGGGATDLDAAIRLQQECPTGPYYFDEKFLLGTVTDAIAEETCQGLLTDYRTCVPQNLDARLVCLNEKLAVTPAASSDEQARTQCQELTAPCGSLPAGAPTKLVVDCAKMMRGRSSCMVTLGEIRTCFARRAAHDRRVAPYPLCSRAGVTGGRMRPDYPDVSDLELEKSCAAVARCTDAF